MAEGFDVFAYATRGVAARQDGAGKRQYQQNFNGTFYHPCLNITGAASAAP